VKDVVTALALLLVIEGLLYSVLPATMRRLSAQVAVLPLPALRYAGLAAACLGVAIVWLIRG